MGVANQQLIRHDPLTSPIGLPDHLSFDLSGWRYRRINPVVLRPTEPFLRGKPLSCAFLCLVRQLRVEPDRRVRGTRKRIQSLASWHRPTPKAPQQTKATPSEYTVFDKPKTPCSPIGYTFYLTNRASTHYPLFVQFDFEEVRTPARGQHPGFSCFILKHDRVRPVLQRRDANDDTDEVVMPFHDGRSRDDGNTLLIK